MAEIIDLAVDSKRLKIPTTQKNAEKRRVRYRIRRITSTIRSTLNIVLFAKLL